jgi:Flp pilus assembly protein TadD
MPARRRRGNPARPARPVFNEALGLTNYCSEARPYKQPGPVMTAFVTLQAPNRSTPSLRARLRLGALIVPVSLAIALSACANAKRAATVADASITTPLTAADFEKALAYWSDRYTANPKDRDTALNYAAALRRVGRSDQAVAVLQKAAINFADDRGVLAAYGKALASNGDLNRALEVVQRAQTPDQPDWQLLSAEAAIRDQLGQHDQARKLYAQALGIAPNEPTTLSNYGMSYVLTGELPEAEKRLRQAVALPGADSRVRQNLALVVGLEGRFDEAAQIAGAELSPEQAAENIAYLK